MEWIGVSALRKKGGDIVIFSGKVKESMQSGQGFSLDSIRRAAEDKIFAAVDVVINRIPNGQQYKDQFRQAIDSALDDLQRQAQTHLGGMMGNLGGFTGRKPDQDNPPAH